MKRANSLALTAAACYSLLFGAAQATKIESRFVQLSGPSWTAEFIVTNDGTVPSVGEFTVYFDENLYSYLTIITSPTTWDTIAIQPDTGIPASGYVDSLAIAPGAALTDSQSQGDFKVGFTLLGGGTPGSQPFEIVDASYQLIESGSTVFTVTSAVPEPDTMWILGIGLLVIAGNRLRKVGFKLSRRSSISKKRS